LSKNEIYIQILKQEENLMEFIIRNISSAFANTLRRIILSEIPILAIDEVVFLENTSVMFDEMLAHRLAMIPLKIDLASYEYFYECWLEGKADNCIVVFKMEVEASDKPTTVFSGHLELIKPAYEDLLKLPLKIEPVSESIPIVKLAPGQRVSLEAYAKLGTAKEHAKWQSVATVYYRNLAKIIIKQEKCDKSCEECVKVCPHNVLEFRNGKIIVINELACDTCRACMEACPDIIEVDWDKNSFLFTIEGIGVLPVSYILNIALNLLERRLIRFKERFNEIKL